MSSDGREMEGTEMEGLHKRKAAALGEVGGAGVGREPREGS